jgi:hypothetical protein
MSRDAPVKSSNGGGSVSSEPSEIRVACCVVNNLFVNNVAFNILSGLGPWVGDHLKVVVDLVVKELSP